MEAPAPNAFADAQPAAEKRGHVTAVGGSKATLRVAPGRLNSPGDAPLTIGKLLAIETATSTVVGAVTSIADRDGSGNNVTADIDLLGELMKGENGKIFFQRGISGYPVIGDPADLLTSAQLRMIYDISGPNTINVGALSQDASIGAYINVDEMVNKHFAVLGTTGVGKSSGVAIILREILRARPNQRIFLLDPHNEYAGCFGGDATVLNPASLRLPFWLFNFEEIVDVFFRARPGVDEEVEILTQVLPDAKERFNELRSAGSRVTLRKAPSSDRAPGFTVDTPVPYRLSDLVALIDERMGKLENRSAFPKYNRLLSRIETVSNDPRYRFMFHNANIGGDTMTDVLSQLFQLGEGSGNVTVLQLAGFPGEVVDSLVSVICRMAFEFGLWSGGVVPILVACEEAHRYSPADRATGFGPTRKAVSRIAKEGRKYGVHLALITQRPAELDPTILSQCSTLFTMRMASERDQHIVRSAVSDAAASLLTFVPSLGTREVFAFGEGVALPTRLRFHKLPADRLPHSTTGDHATISGAMNNTMIASVVERWRGASMSRGNAIPPEDDDGLGDMPSAATPLPPLTREPPLNTSGDRLVNSTAARG